MEVLEAIRRRRSIRKFRDTQLSREQIRRLTEAARLAPSGSNVQPWRFIIVKDKRLKRKLRKASFNQEFVESAAVVIVCCGDLTSWKRTRRRVKGVLRRGDIKLGDDAKKELRKRNIRAATAEMNERVPTTMLNVAIATEHIVLEAVELGLGSCWVRLFDEKKIKEALDLPERLYVVALLPIGVPDEAPDPRPRLSSSTIIVRNR